MAGPKDHLSHGPDCAVVGAICCAQAVSVNKLSDNGRDLWRQEDECSIMQCDRVEFMVEICCEAISQICSMKFVSVLNVVCVCCSTCGQSRK